MDYIIFNYIGFTHKCIDTDDSFQIHSTTEVFLLENITDYPYNSTNKEVVL